MQDLLLKRYNDMQYICDMETDMFIELIQKAIEENMKDKLWEKWLQEKPEVSFDQYIEKHTPQLTKSEEDILEDAENILKSMSKPK